MKTWSFILNKSKEKKKIILLVVINNDGSSPGRKGFKMAVSEDGQLRGSIGGGVMEQHLVEAARSMISANDEQIILRQQEHNPEAIKDSSGMICSGSQTIAMFPITRLLLSEIEQIVSYLSDNEVGLIKYSRSGVRLLRNMHQDEKYISRIMSDTEWELSEQTGMSDKLYIFGAGHVSLALSRICAFLDFDIELFDDRKDLNTFYENDWVKKKQIVDYNDISSLVQDGYNCYAVIISFSHTGDETILGQLLEKKLRYLGMMGSKAKVKKIKNKLYAKGFTEEQLSGVHAPIGISINSQTPEEIAISIAAQIISVRNKVSPPAP
ncbi:MAG: XdhC family protein [Bacteroidota bacterium]|nr:XdhC family protein [Bacteroidota bacterium]